MFWEAFLGIIIAIIIYNLIHRIFVVNPTKKTQLASEQHCQAILNSFLKKLPADGYNLKIVNSKVLSDVWGRGIQVFEYRLAIDDQNPANKLNYLKEHLNQLFNERNQNPAVDDNQIKITDLWRYRRSVHIEMAYLANQSTEEYINDIERLTE
ncbi:hypothetical protein [Lactobacillus sp. Sy-1]|uniref:hypothetical protein n=1 Tax=Lactobacillus sp. Sy-1 TaxID=2109645 RepID=UPI001C58D1C2|nr:hypothetical protein [Lactobacillus sp. Sy-1]MBW1605439.1 hypothetical protein [Lactobacillus sp. Sy-1]